MWATIQRRLQQFGYDPGPIDNDPGERTFGALFGYMGARDRAAFGHAAAEHLPAFQINTPLRLAHFLAQAAHETGEFRFMREIWGPTEAQRRYEGRADLGNCIAGDGRRYLGRGIFQLTGRDNYQRFGQLCGHDLACSPHLAELPDVALHIACLYWDQHRLNQYADADNILAVSNGINRGNPGSIREPNGYADRKAKLAKAKKALIG